MNLVVLAAVIAVASAAKLDRTYLPPPSAKTAGGSPGALQAPFSNQGLGGIPKGAFENDFKGVVVDAAAPGTRASAEETGLGAPRIAYGSTNSKVGDAAFRGTPNSFQFPRQNQFGNQNQIPDGATAGTTLDAQSFVQPGVQGQTFPQGSANTQAQSFAQGPGNAQSQSFPQGPGNQGPSSAQGSGNAQAQSFAQRTGNQGQSFGSQNIQGSEPSVRSQELNARDAAANIVRFDSDVGSDSFSYSFETDNGISAEESGVATNGVQAQGGFSYTGDDGQVYSVTYTADEGGYQPKGDHLPTPPPIPEEILRSLEQNAREEAAGLVDDGSYDAQKYNAEGDYTENDGALHNGRQPAQFGNRPESDVSASGTFINQNNQPFVKPNVNGQVGQSGQSGSVAFGSSSRGPNTFGQAAATSNAPNGFGQQASSLNEPNAFGQNGSPSSEPIGFEQASSPSNVVPNSFGQVASPSRRPNGFGQSNQAVNSFQLNKPSFNNGVEDSENANTFVNPTFETTQAGSNAIQEQDKPQLPSFGKPQSSSQVFSTGLINDNNNFGPATNNANTFGQRQPSGQSGNRFGSNEYLPPFNGNRRPTQATPQRPNSFGATQNTNQFSQSVTKPQDFGTSSSTFESGSQSNVESQAPQFGFQNNQFANNKKPANPSLSQNIAEAQSNEKPTFGGSQNVASSIQASGNFSPFKQQQSTAQPEAELTTPFEDNTNSQQENSHSTAFGSLNSQSNQGRPTQSPFGSQPSNNGASQFTAPASTSASAFASVSSVPQGFDSRPSGPKVESSSQFSNQRPQIQYTQENNFAQSQSSDTFSQNQPSDAQFAPSTQRPIFSQNNQAQGADDSYYYKQPSKVFSTPSSQAQGNRFPNTPFNQFNRMTQRPSFQSNAQPSVSQQNFQGNSFNQNRQPQGSTRYPQAPFLTSVAPTSPTQGSTAASFNGITQASASSFASRAPTPSTQFGTQNTFSGFGRRPTQQSNRQYNNQVSQSTSSQQGFGKQTTAIPQTFSNFDRTQQQGSFQNQQQESNNAGQQSPTAEEVPAVTVNPYEGEIYEYNKPSQTLPPPTEQDVKDGFGQFGNPSKFKGQSAQKDKPQESSDTQPGATQGRPQISSQPSRPQFGQKIQTSQQTQFSQSSRPQFGQQPTPFGNARPNQSSFAQSSAVQKPQPSQENQFNSQSNENTEAQSQQKFGSRPVENQPSQFNGQSVQQPGSQEQKARPSCCRKLPSAPQTQAQSNQFVGQSQGQFGSSDVTAQGFKPDQASAQSFAGKGEVFGGPRKPPSFDEETGYHY